MWSCTGVIPPLRRWKQEGRESKVIPSDILRIRPVWAAWDPAANRTITRAYNIGDTAQRSLWSCSKPTVNIGMLASTSRVSLAHTDLPSSSAAEESRPPQLSLLYTAHLMVLYLRTHLAAVYCDCHA